MTENLAVEHLATAADRSLRDQRTKRSIGALFAEFQRYPEPRQPCPVPLPEPQQPSSSLPAGPDSPVFALSAQVNRRNPLILPALACPRTRPHVSFRSSLKQADRPGHRRALLGRCAVFGLGWLCELRTPAPAGRRDPGPMGAVGCKHPMEASEVQARRLDEGRQPSDEIQRAHQTLVTGRCSPPPRRRRG